jgi:hypothetical protein
MELAIYLFLLYLAASIIVSMEGVKHQIGGVNAFLLSLVLTPIVGILIVRFSPRSVNVSHYVKRSDCKDCSFNDDSTEDACEICEKHAYWVEV